MLPLIKSWLHVLLASYFVKNYRIMDVKEWHRWHWKMMIKTPRCTGSWDQHPLNWTVSSSSWHGAYTATLGWQSNWRNFTSFTASFLKILFKCTSLIEVHAQIDKAANSSRPHLSPLSFWTPLEYWFSRWTINLIFTQFALLSLFLLLNGRFIFQNFYE